MLLSIPLYRRNVGMRRHYSLPLDGGGGMGGCDFYLSLCPFQGMAVYMKMLLPFIHPPLPSKRRDEASLFPPPRRGREGWGLFSCFVVPHSGMRVSRFPGLSYSRGSILTGTAVFFLKVSLSSSVPIPLPTCMGMASLGRILSAAAAASSAVIT